MKQTPSKPYPDIASSILEAPSQSNGQALTERQRRFAEGVSVGMSKLQSYVCAGYRATGATAKVEASRLSRNPLVKSYLAHLRESRIEGALLNRQRKRERLAEIVEGKVANATVSDMLRAIQIDNSMTGENESLKATVNLSFAALLAEIDSAGIPCDDL